MTPPTAPPGFSDETLFSWTKGGHSAPEPQWCKYEPPVAYGPDLPPQSPPLSPADENRLKAKANYPPWSPERFVARHFGELLPDMRDELLLRKANNEGFWERHYHAWSKLSNWIPNKKSEPPKPSQ